MAYPSERVVGRNSAGISSARRPSLHRRHKKSDAASSCSRLSIGSRMHARLLQELVAVAGLDARLDALALALHDERHLYTRRPERPHFSEEVGEARHGLAIDRNDKIARL